MSIHTFIHSYIHPSIQPYIHTYMHTHICSSWHPFVLAPPAPAQDWYAQTLHGMMYCHFHGIVHRDIKPGSRRNKKGLPRKQISLPMFFLLRSSRGIPFVILILKIRAWPGDRQTILSS